jgi:hypothetical protein
MKRLFTATLLCLILTGCALSQSDIAWANYEAAFKKYNTSVVSADGQLTKSKVDYYSDLSQIAYQNYQQHLGDIWWMLANESALQASGKPNNVASLEARINASDKSLTSEAEFYRLNIAVQKKCESFGYVVGSPDFNKCVYDLKVQFVQNRQAIRQQIWSMPISTPSYSTTKCINTAFGINCNTTGF